MTPTQILYQVQVNNLLPVRKRTAGMMDYLISLTTPLQWLNNIWSNIYINSGINLSSAWSNSITYNIGDSVVGSDNAVYLSLVNSNINHNPTSTTGYWQKVQDNFISVLERVGFNAQILTLEYALNLWFRTTFRQPPSTPDIYIQTNPVVPAVFVVGGLESNSSQSYYFDFVNFNYVIDSYTITQYNFTIYIPTAVWTALGSNTTGRDNVVRLFANQYNLAGMLYNIQPY